MGQFRDAQHFYETVGELMDRAKKNPQVGPKIAKAGIIVQFRYSDPEAVTTINARAKATQPEAYVDIFHGPSDLKPDVIMTMKADVAHAFWHGKVNLMTALMKKEIVAQGSLTSILKLLPAVEPLYKEYPQLLREKGYASMIMK